MKKKHVTILLLSYCRLRVFVVPGLPRGGKVEWHFLASPYCEKMREENLGEEATIMSLFLCVTYEFGKS
jgi:hypothetical protein